MLQSRKRKGDIPLAPASGGAIVCKPGTNFAKSSVFGPRRSKLARVLRTQESGSSDAAEQPQHAVSLAAPDLEPEEVGGERGSVAARSVAPGSSRPVPTRPPQTTRAGGAGIGMPS
ncbi:MAG: hypothetical protein R3E53_02635 [Myxococcota bacterium]